MKLSIVIPSLNQARFLPACLESVLTQVVDGHELEVLVYDGGSTDDSRKIIERQAPRLTYWQSQPDGGQAAALKAGFARASGDIFGWVNSDDLLFPGALSTIVRSLSDCPEAVLVYGDAIWLDAEGHVIRSKREIDFDWDVFAYGYCYLPQPSTFFRREAYLAVGGLDPSFECNLDYDLWHRLTRQGKVVHLKSFLSGMRDHPATKTNRLRCVFDREHEILRKRYLKCSRPRYRMLHVWHRARRVLQRLSAGCYRPPTQEELRACGLKVPT